MQIPIPDMIDITSLSDVARKCEMPVLGYAGQEVIRAVRDAWARGEAELPWVRPWGNPKHDVYTGAMRHSAEARPANIRAPAVPFGLRDQLRLLALRDHKKYRTNYWIGNRAIDELQVELFPGGEQRFVALVGNPQAGSSKSYKGWAERLTVNIDEIEPSELTRIGVSVQARDETGGDDSERDSQAATALSKKLSSSPGPMGVRVDHSTGNDAFYMQAEDQITIPQKAAFDASHHYWATLFHEHVHATAHPKRLGRKEPAVFPEIGELDRDERYAYEELVAELGAALACEACAVDGRKELHNAPGGHARYIAGWAELLRRFDGCLEAALEDATLAVRWMHGKPRAKQAQAQMRKTQERLNARFSKDA